MNIIIFITILIIAFLLNSCSKENLAGINKPNSSNGAGIYKMRYKNLESNGDSTVSYAESNDGITWEIIGDGPVLDLGQQGSWDAGAVTTGPVIKENGVYKIYYSAAVEAHQPWQVGLAASSDGIHWEKYSNPVLQSTSSQYFLGVHSVLKINNLYYMYYEASPENDYTFNLNLATSSDGIHWTKYEDNPILIADQNWEEGSIGYATIVQSDNEYKMTYSSNVQNAVGMTYSNDGINWSKNDANPGISNCLMYQTDGVLK